MNDPDSLRLYVDAHVLMALRGAEKLGMDRDAAEDYVRDRLVAVSDSFPSAEELEAEDSRRKIARLSSLIYDEPKG